MQLKTSTDVLLRVYFSGLLDRSCEGWKMHPVSCSDVVLALKYIMTLRIHVSCLCLNLRAEYGWKCNASLRARFIMCIFLLLMQFWTNKTRSSIKANYVKQSISSWETDGVIQYVGMGGLREAEKKWFSIDDWTSLRSSYEFLVGFINICGFPLDLISSHTAQLHISTLQLVRRKSRGR